MKHVQRVSDSMLLTQSLWGLQANISARWWSEGCSASGTAVMQYFQAIDLWSMHSFYISDMSVLVACL